METAKSARKKSNKAVDDKIILEAYKKHILLHGVPPASVYKFCLDLEISEDLFYNYFSSFEVIDRAVWKDFATTTIDKLHADAAFNDFSTREKLLTFYFALAEVLKANRSYILVIGKEHKLPEVSPVYLKDFKKSFEAFVEQLVHEGMGKEEIAKRPFVDKRYPALFWVHMNFFLLFWKNDTSKGFEKTDVFIEKSINLAFDLIGKGAIDSAIDLLKFLYQSRANS